LTVIYIIACIALDLAASCIWVCCCLSYYSAVCSQCMCDSVYHHVSCLSSVSCTCTFVRPWTLSVITQARHYVH